MNLISEEYCSDEEEQTEQKKETKGIPDVTSVLPAIGHSLSSLPQPNYGGYVSKRRNKGRSAYVQSSSHSKTQDHIISSTSYSRLSSYLLSPPPNTTTSTSTVDRASSHKSLVWKTAHTKPILSLDWHPVRHELLLSSSLDGHLKVWNTTCKDDCLSQVSFGSPSPPIHVAKWLPCSSSHVLTGGMDRIMRLLDINTLQTISTTSPLDGSITALAQHTTDNNVYVTGDTCKTVKSWDLRSQKLINSYSGAGGQILDLGFINEGQELVASSDIVRKNAASQMLLVWDYSSCLVQSRQIYCEPYTCPCIRSHPYEKTFMAQSNANYIVLFSAKPPYKMNKWKRFESHTVGGYQTQFDVSCDGGSVVSASSDSSLCVYDWKSSRLKKKHYFCPGRSPSIAVQCHPVDPSLVACSYWNGSLAVGTL